jgi:hypothetical protein
MTKQKLTLEVTDCSQMEDGDVLISPKRGRGILVLALGLPLALVGLGLFVSDPFESCYVTILLLALGVALSYVGVRAFLAPEIEVSATERVIRVRARGSQSAQTRPFDALVGPVNVATLEFGFSLFLVSLRFDEGKPQSLFATGDKKKAQEIVRWLEAALAPNGTPLDCAACGAWNLPGSEHCGECGAALAGAEA